jgi:hypothetical protein
MILGLSTVLTSPGWFADAAERWRVKQEEDDANAERALQRKQQRRWRKTKVIDLRRAFPTANERQADEALEVPGPNAMRRKSGQTSTL